MKVRPNDVVDVNPGHPLATRSDGSTHVAAKRGREGGKRAMLAKDGTRPHQSDSDASVGARLGFVFPVPAKPREIGFAPGCGLRDLIFVEEIQLGESVIVDSRGIDEDSRTFLFREGSDGFGDEAGRVGARVMDSLAKLCVPALTIQRLASEVDDGIAARNGALPLSRVAGISRDDLDRFGKSRFGGIAAEHDDFVTAFDEGSRECPPDRAGSAAEKNSQTQSL